MRCPRCILYTARPSLSLSPSLSYSKYNYYCYWNSFRSTMQLKQLKWHFFSRFVLTFSSSWVRSVCCAVMCAWHTQQRRNTQSNENILLNSLHSMPFFSLSPLLLLLLVPDGNGNHFVSQPKRNNDSPLRQTSLVGISICECVCVSVEK